MRFLSQVYNYGNEPIQTATQAYELFLLAELFDADKLRRSCSTFLSDNAHTILLANVLEEGALKWLLFAEKYGIAQLRAACIGFVSAKL